jgi:hypothetical protein
MASRPERIDIPTLGAGPLSRPLFTPHGKPVAQNEVPPALSPLDAFAMQGRLLAKRFEEENNTGRRISRLPTMTIASELAKARPEYFRAMTTGSQQLVSPSQLMPEEISVQRSATEVQSAPRPLSHYPQMILTDSLSSGRGLYYQTQLGNVQESDVEHADLAIPRSQSPEDIFTIPTAPVRNDLNRSPPLPPANSSTLCVTPTKFTIGPSLMSYSASQAPKAAGGSPSIRPVYDHDDVTSLPSLEASVASLSLEKSRPLAESASMLRTSSTNSERSLAGTPPRPSFNYSRPISRQSGPEGRRAESPHRGGVNMRGPPLDTIYRQDSAEAPVPAFLNDSPQTPVSLASEELFSTPDARVDSTPSSFVYAKYALPNKTKRESLGISEFINKQFNWDDPDAESQIGISFANAPFLAQAPPSPALTGSPGIGHEVVITGPASPARSLHSRKRLQKSRPGTPSGPTPAAAAAESAISLIRPNRQTSKTSPPPPPAPPTMTPPTTAISTTTISAAATAARDPVIEEHLQRGIDLHEQGALQESTYHLRIAAKAGHPTAMVLYALACRHGWGMKAAPEEGVAWLTRAVECSHSEIAEAERKGGAVRGEDVANRKASKAQFALGVYELAQSYMNGWGVAQDRALGVRCFEIAGSWGDADGLAAAAHCYMEGIGVKKDLKKSARLFRQAEARGVSVAGNSWWVSTFPLLDLRCVNVGQDSQGEVRRRGRRGRVRRRRRARRQAADAQEHGGERQAAREVAHAGLLLAEEVQRLGGRLMSAFFISAIYMHTRSTSGFFHRHIIVTYQGGWIVALGSLTTESVRWRTLHAILRDNALLAHTLSRQHLLALSACIRFCPSTSFGLLMPLIPFNTQSLAYNCSAILPATEVCR